MSDGTRVTVWQEVHARLERARLAMESGGELQPEEIARILTDRARALAEPLEDGTPSTEMIELLVVSLGGERFGIETVYAIEAISLRELIPVPCTPAFVLGVVNYRGRILAVLDLRRILGLSGEGVTEGSKVVSVEAGGMTFGIIVDTIAGTMSVPAHKVAPPPEALTGLRLVLTRGMTEELITILDLDALARAPAILVNEQVS
jgi:purine-binding chemotaxis protein CheW